MKSISKTISLRGDLYADATSRQNELRFASFSDYVQDLIRKDLLQRSEFLREALSKHPDDPFLRSLAGHNSSSALNEMPSASDEPSPVRYTRPAKSKTVAK